MNQHLLSAQEVDAYFEAVRRFGVQPGEDDDLSDENLTDDVFDDVGQRLELVVGRTLLDEDADVPALQFLDSLMESLGDDDDAEVVGHHQRLPIWMARGRTAQLESGALRRLPGRKPTSAKMPQLRPSAFPG